jgi:hypothetical protein
MPRTFAPAKKDLTQKGIEQAFIASDWAVCDVHALGKDAPDLFVSKGGHTTIAIEAKTGNRKRKAHQVEWAENWKGHYLTGNDAEALLRSAQEIYLSEIRNRQ